MNLNHPVTEEWLQRKATAGIRAYLFKKDAIAKLKSLCTRLKKYEQLILYMTCAVAIVTVFALLIQEHQAELAQAHTDGFVVGYGIGQTEQRELLKGKVTTDKCMAFWFSGDSTKVGRALRDMKAGVK